MNKEKIDVDTESIRIRNLFAEEFVRVLEIKFFIENSENLKSEKEEMASYVKVDDVVIPIFDGSE